MVGLSWKEDAKMEGGRGNNLGEVRQKKWLPSRVTGWATGLTRAQKRFATQRAAGVAREGSSSQLVPVDTFFPFSRILTFVLLMHWGLPLLLLPGDSIAQGAQAAFHPGAPVTSLRLPHAVLALRQELKPGEVRSCSSGADRQASPLPGPAGSEGTDIRIGSPSP